jgi:hypothetical protein
MELIILGIIFLATLGFLVYINERNHKIKVEEFREFVIATKSKNIEEYNLSIPEKNELPEENNNEIIELDQVPPEQLIKLINKEE